MSSGESRKSKRAGLETRLVEIGLSTLLRFKIAYRNAHFPLHPHPYREDPRMIYHSLWPSPPLSPVPDLADPSTITLQKDNEAAYRDLLVQGLLALLLPTEDLENDCLTSLVGGILSDMIIGNGIGVKASEPWLLWEGIAKIIEVVQEQISKTKTKPKDLVGIPPAQLGKPQDDKAPVAIHTKSSWRAQMRKTFWLVLQHVFLALTTIRLIISTIATSSSLPTRIKPFIKKSNKQTTASGHLQPPPSPFSTRSFSSQMSTTKHNETQPIVNMKIWPCVSSLLDLNVRLPWLCATLSFLQWGAVHGPGQLGGTDRIIDK